MTMIDIYSILASKPHNSHHLKRYFNYILACQRTFVEDDEYREDHHICPKADDLFPEYINQTIYTWNSILLTTKQHIIAHIILSLAYGESQTIAKHFMLNVQNEGIGVNNRRIPTCIQIRYAAKARQEFIAWRKGRATYKDSDGNKFFLKTNDPIIQELNLVGNNAGLVMSEESRQSMRDAKFPNKTVIVYFLDNYTSIKLFTEEFSEYIAQGWSTRKTDDDYTYCQQLGNILHSKFWTGRSRYATQDGIYHGSYLYTDPIIKYLGLIQYRSQAQIDQNASRTILATAAKLGKNYYTNGIDEKFLFEPIDETWVLGRAPRNGDWEVNRMAAFSLKIIGSKTYTNGLANIPLQPHDIVPDGFYLGMKYRERNYYYTNDLESEILTFYGNHTIPIGYHKVVEQKANRILDHIKLINYDIINIVQAKEFIKLCMISDYVVNSNMSKYVKIHEQQLRDISGFYNINHTDLLKCIHNNIEPPKCKFCGIECNSLKNTFCSESCRSKMKKTNTKSSRKLLAEKI